jgi:hypothetical protein
MQLQSVHLTETTFLFLINVEIQARKTKQLQRVSINVLVGTHLTHFVRFVIIVAAHNLILASPEIM